MLAAGPACNPLLPPSAAPALAHLRSASVASAVANSESPLHLTQLSSTSSRPFMADRPTCSRQWRSTMRVSADAVSLMPTKLQGEKKERDWRPDEEQYCSTLYITPAVHPTLLPSGGRAAICKAPSPPPHLPCSTSQRCSWM